MKSLVISVAFVCIAVSATQAQPTEESVRRLLQVSKAQALMDIMFAGVDASMRQNMNAAYSRQTLTAAQRQALEQIPAKFMEVFRGEFNWEKMEPEYIKLYQQTFSQEEVDGLIGVYSSPLGQTLTEKMPQLAQRSMAVGQARAMAALPKVRAVIDQALREAGLAP